MIAGFELPTDGQILLNGEDISQLPANKRPINTVFQRYALFPHMNIYENIAFGLKLKKLPKEEMRKKVKHVLDNWSTLKASKEQKKDIDTFRWTAAENRNCKSTCQ